MPTFTLQEKIINHLAKVSEDCGLDFVKHNTCPNSGTVYLQSGFDTRLSFFYHFDSVIKFQFYSHSNQARMAWGDTPSDCLLNLTLDAVNLSSGLKKIEELIKTESVKTSPKNNKETVVFATLKYEE
jgi:hypothetical protein